LYIALGDGGNANDVGDGHNAATGNGQDPTTVLGKVLRIDPHGNNSANHQYGIPTDNPFVNATTPNTVKEIYSYGFRNPYRFSFDSGGTHQLIVADVGQDNIEEIDKVTKGGNYGWHYKEGTFAFDPTNGHVTSDLSTVPTNLTDPNGSAITLTDPVAEYDHTQGIAIVGGFVYRGSLLPQLQGKYVFGDFSRSFGAPSGRLFYLDLTTGEISEFLNGLKDINPQFVKGMGEGRRSRTLSADEHCSRPRRHHRHCLRNRPGTFHPWRSRHRRIAARAPASEGVASTISRSSDAPKCLVQ